MKNYYLRLCDARNATGERCRFALGHPAEHLWGHPENMEEECESCGIGYSLHLESGHPFAWTGRFTTKRASTPAETLIYERRTGETCSCARLNAREGAALTYYCSRCPPPTIAEAQRAAWKPKDGDAFDALVEVHRRSLIEAWLREDDVALARLKNWAARRTAEARREKP